MALPHPFLQQIDHIGIQADNPRALFEFFTEVLKLPVAFPYIEYPYYTSGSVVLGNIFLEIMRFGSSHTTPRSPSARYHILGFLTRPGTLAGSLAELEQRDVPHSGLVPFFAPEATDENPTAIWANVYLGGLLGENAWMRLLFAMTKQAKPKPSRMRLPLVNKISLALMAGAFRDGLPVLTEYYLGHDDAKRAADWEALRQGQGGGLGVECVQEVIVGVPAHTRYQAVWAQLLAPKTLNLDNRSDLEPGPAIRLVTQAQPGIQTIVLQVTSLARVETFARRMGIPTVMKADRMVLKLPQTTGLMLQLTE